MSDGYDYYDEEIDETIRTKSVPRKGKKMVSNEDHNLPR